MPLAEVTPERYQRQLKQKFDEFCTLLKEIDQGSHPTPEIFASPPSHYRLRAEFNIRHQGNRSFYTMTDPDTKTPVFIEDFPVAAKPINRIMTPLLEAINRQPLLQKKLFQVTFLTTLTQDTLVTLIYHRPLDEDWQTQARSLAQDLNINLIGRSRKQKIVLNRDYVTEQFTVQGQTYQYQQKEGGFTQPNGRVCEHMLSWVATNSLSFGGDLLELYCGNGNFSLPLSKNFRQVLATEISKTSVASAQQNLLDNQIDNVAVVRMSSEDLVRALNQERVFRRLKGVDLTKYNFSTVFVDPPRAGLDTATLNMVQDFDNIIYLSCNPHTLAANLKILCRHYKVTAVAIFDQFPYTHHLETGVVLTRT